MNIRISVQGELSTNSYIIDDGHIAYVIDPVEDGQKTKQFIKEQKLNLQGIILTHFHLDHIKATPDFRDTNIYISEVDYNNIMTTGAMELMRTEFYPAGYLSKSGAETICHVLSGDKVHKINDGFVFPFAEKLTCILTPGHTDGSICIYAPADDGALFSGDTLFFQSHGRTDLPTASTRDMLESLKRLSTLPQTTRVYPGHGNLTSIGSEREYGVLLRFAHKGSVQGGVI